MKKRLLITIGILSSLLSRAQTTIWLEDFSGYPNQTTQSADWATIAADTDDGGVNMGTNFWGTTNGEFRCNDIEGPGPSQDCQNFLTTRYFPIPCFSNVSASVDVRYTGTMECGGGFNANDEVDVYYSINNGAWTLFPVNGYICGSNGLPTSASVSGLSGDSIAIRIMMGNKANDENYYIDNIHIWGYPPNFADAGPDLQACSGTPFTLNATGGISYNWSPSSGLSCVNCQNPTVNQPVNQSYIVQVTDANNCVDSDTVVVNIIPGPQVNLGNDTSLCPGQSFVLDAGNPGNTYTWQDNSGSQFFVVNQPGTYYVEVDNGNCAAHDTVQVIAANFPQVDLGPDVSVCNGQPVTLDAGNPGSAYLWSTTEITQAIVVNTTGLYSVTVTNACGTSSGQVQVNIAQAPSVNLGADISLCTASLPYLLDAANPGAQFLWQDQSTASQFQVMQAGTYFVTVTNNCGSDTDTIIVTPGAQAVEVFTEPLVFCEEGMITLDAENPGADYQWSTGDTTQTIQVDESGEYIVNIHLCDGSITDTAVVIFQNNQAGPFIPNTFTPNNDGINDLYNIGFTPEALLEFECLIFDRWGLQVYSSDNPAFQWTGKYNGADLVAGVYYIVVRYRKICDATSQQEAASFVQLLR